MAKKESWAWQATGAQKWFPDWEGETYSVNGRRAGHRYLVLLDFLS
jgi:hypothetical protein